MDGLELFVDELPRLKNPLLIAGFDGWGNALNTSKGMVDYLIRHFAGQEVARINPDLFYQYNLIRPQVAIQEGILQTLSPPGGSFFAIRTDKAERDLVILSADEPNLRWQLFVEELCAFAKKLGVDTIVTLGAFFDNVLHTDRIVSGYASNEDLLAELSRKNVNLVSYQGPSAIHTSIHTESGKADLKCIGLWCHCPYYLESMIHTGIMAHLGNLLSFLGDFRLDTKELEKSWEKLTEKIQDAVETNPDLASLVTKIRKQKVRGTLEGKRTSSKENQKVINIQDFINPKQWEPVE